MFPASDAMASVMTSASCVVFLVSANERLMPQAYQEDSEKRNRKELLRTWGRFQHRFE